MVQVQPDIVLEERYRTPANYFLLALYSVFPAFACLIIVAASLHGFEKIAWQIYLFYTPFLLFGIFFAVGMVYLGYAIVRNTRGVLRVDAQQLVLQTAYYHKTIPLREIVVVEETVQKLGRSNRIGLCICQGLKGYYFYPTGLSNSEVVELIDMLNDLVNAARRVAKSAAETT